MAHTSGRVELCSVHIARSPNGVATLRGWVAKAPGEDKRLGADQVFAVAELSRQDGRAFRAQGVPHRSDMLVIERRDVGMYALRFAQRPRG